MNGKQTVFLIITTLTMLLSCKDNPPPNIVGLWVVTRVTVGKQELTPNSKWARFNTDSTQESGNGWYQHSVGTWKFEASNSELIIKTTNGLNDPYPPFKVTLENEVMVWNRTEDGQPVEVTLERTDQLPMSYGDELLGLWKLRSAAGNGKYFIEADDDGTDSFLFLRWDRLFTISTQKGRTNGVYNVNGHRPELELIPYGDSVSRNFWTIQYGDNSIKLTLINSENVVTREFVRIHEFPE